MKNVHGLVCGGSKIFAFAHASVLLCKLVFDWIEIMLPFFVQGVLDDLICGTYDTASLVRQFDDQKDTVLFTLAFSLLGPMV